MLLWLFGNDRPVTRARLEAIRVAGTTVVAAGGMAALWLAARKQRSTELELHRQYQADHANQLDAAERRITELYTTAADHLGSDKAPVRLAGLYALERVGIGAPDQQATIINVICAYLRMPYLPPPAQPPTDGASSRDHDLYEQRIQEQQVRLTAQRILHRHLTTLPPVDGKPDPRWPGLAIDLTGAQLHGVDFGQTDLTDADFSDATLVEARLASSVLSHAVFTRADLHRADLSTTQALRAGFAGADLSGANLTGAMLREADLTGTRLTGTDLSNADLTGAVLTETELNDAILDGTKLRSMYYIRRS